jgi:hypothetical protein
VSLTVRTASAHETYNSSRYCPRCKEPDHFEIHCDGWGVAFEHDETNSMAQASARTDAWRKSGAYLEVTPCRRCGHRTWGALTRFALTSAGRAGIFIAVPTILTALNAESWWVLGAGIAAALVFGAGRGAQLVSQAKVAVQQVEAPKEE